MTASAISWTDRNWITVAGCTDASTGCLNCYARQTTLRIAGAAKGSDGLPDLSAGTVVNTGDGLEWTGKVNVTNNPRLIEAPTKWRDPAMVFVNSRGDTFHPKVPTGHIRLLFEVMARCPQHSFQVLTKRPERMRQMSNRYPWFGQRHAIDNKGRGYTRVLPNLWAGTSIESDEWTHRADAVRGTLAGIRWISAEPLLGPLPSLDLTGIDWLVVGGESKSGARPMDLGWARELRDRCAESGTAFYFKQTGTVVAKRLGLKEAKGEDITDPNFPQDLAIREYPEQVAA